MSQTKARLIDEYMPKWDVREQHSIQIPVSQRKAYDAIRSTDLVRGGIVSVLFLLRGLPAALFSRRGFRLRSVRREPVTLAAFEKRGFRVLEESPPEELLIGLEGQFWTFDGGIKTPDANVFRRNPPAPGSARAVWNFLVEQTGPGIVRLSTETRVVCADRHARTRFIPYWTIVRPGSGLIRRSMLRAIRETAIR